MSIEIIGDFEFTPGGIANFLSSGRHYITSGQMNLAMTCEMFVDTIENVGSEQEELNSKLYKQFTMGTL